MFIKAVVIIFIVSATLIFTLRWLFENNNSLYKITHIFQAVTTGVGILAAGYFYTVERRASPSLDISQSNSAFFLNYESGNYVSIEVNLHLKNVGNTLLKLRSLDARLSRVDPSGLDLNELGNLPRDSWPSQFSDKNTEMYNVTEMRWPILRYVQSSIKRDIEPGESDIIIISFVVPCGINVVKVSAQLQKPGHPNLWWKTVGYVSIGDLCRSRESLRGR
jgi:hypothetical protein